MFCFKSLETFWNSFAWHRRTEEIQSISTPLPHPISNYLQQLNLKTTHMFVLNFHVRNQYEGSGLLTLNYLPCWSIFFLDCHHTFTEVLFQELSPLLINLLFKFFSPLLNLTWIIQSLYYAPAGRYTSDSADKGCSIIRVNLYWSSMSGIISLVDQSSF